MCGESMLCLVCPQGEERTTGERWSVANYEQILNKVRRRGESEN